MSELTKEQRDKLEIRAAGLAEVLGCTPEEALRMLMQGSPEQRQRDLQMVADDYQAAGEFKRNPKRTRAQLMKDAMREAKRRRKAAAAKKK